MSKSDPPRIHTLRTDGSAPKTSDCFTPRTMEGTDGAFKSGKYGDYMEGPYRGSNRLIGPLLWAFTIALALVSAVLAAIA